MIAALMGLQTCAADGVNQARHQAGAGTAKQAAGLARGTKILW